MERAGAAPQKLLANGAGRRTRRAAKLPPPRRGAREPPAFSLDHLVGAGEERRRYLQTENTSGLQIDHELEFCGLLDRRIRGVAPLRILST